jgi:hypothetical protein
MLEPNSGYAGNDYSGEKISGEIVAAVDASAQTVTYTLPYTPIKPGTVVITDGAKSISDTDRGNGTGTFAGTLLSGTATNNTINYATGAVKVDIVATVSDVTAAWEYDLNSPDAQVNDVNVTVASEPVIARPRKLKSLYMFDRSLLRIA